MPALHLKHSFVLKDWESLCSARRSGCPRDGTRQPWDGAGGVRGVVQVGLCSRRAGVPFRVGAGTWAFMGFRRLIGRFFYARQFSSSCKLCWLLEQTVHGVLRDGFGEMYLVCKGQSAQLLHTCSLASTRSSHAPQDQHLGSWTVSMELTQLRTTPWEGESYLSAGWKKQPGHHYGESYNIRMSGQGRSGLLLPVADRAGSNWWTAA